MELVSKDRFWRLIKFPQDRIRRLDHKSSWMDGGRVWMVLLMMRDEKITNIYFEIQVFQKIHYIAYSPRHDHAGFMITSLLDRVLLF